jgi:hypothetical protein
MQTVNNSVTLDFRVHSPFIFLARQSYAIALLIAFAFLYISLSDYILVSFVTYVLHSLILFVSSVPFSRSLFSSFCFFMIPSSAKLHVQVHMIPPSTFIKCIFI